VSKNSKLLLKNLQLRFFCPYFALYSTTTTL
jgi:hypothetical protein